MNLLMVGQSARCITFLDRREVWAQRGSTLGAENFSLGVLHVVQRRPHATRRAVQAGAYTPSFWSCRCAPTIIA